MTVKLHRCGHVWLKTPLHPCWVVQKALNAQGVDYEIVPGPWPGRKGRTAMWAADFASPRGSFRFNTNGYPIQDFYLVKAAKRSDGLYETEIVQKVFSDYADGFAKDCPLK